MQRTSVITLLVFVSAVHDACWASLWLWSTHQLSPGQSCPHSTRRMQLCFKGGQVCLRPCRQVHSATLPQCSDSFETGGLCPSPFFRSMKTSAVSTNTQSRFTSVVHDGVLGPELVRYCLVQQIVDKKYLPKYSKVPTQLCLGPSAIPDNVSL